MTNIITAMIIAAAQVNGIDPILALSVAHVESNLNPHAVSSKNAYGVMQLRGIAFPQYTVKQLKSLDVNISVGVRHLVYMRDKCRFKKANTWLSCYNRGLVGAKRGIVNPYKDAYYLKVMKKYKELKRLNEKTQTY
jgi:soluble lytic murein transglycosylase-like protein